MLDLRNPRPGIEQQYRKIIEPLQKEIENLRRDRDQRILEIEGQNTDQLRRLDDEKQRLLEERDRLNMEWGARLDAERDRLSSLQGGQVERDQRILENQTEVAVINNKINELEKARIPMARQDQVRRIAGWVFGLSPEDVVKEQANMVGLIWFGSISVLAAFAGPLTAIVALGLQSIGARRADPKFRDSALSRFLRRWLLRWRWKRVRTVEKIVEKPIETTVKEILYVPILTDDPGAVRKILNEELPPEFSEHVSVDAVGGSPEEGSLGPTSGADKPAKCAQPSVTRRKPRSPRSPKST